MRNKWIVFLVIVLFLTVLPVNAMEQTMDFNRRGSVSVTLTSQDGEVPLAGAELSVYYVGTWELNSQKGLLWYYTEEFAHCDIPKNDKELARKLDAFVSEEIPPFRKMVTDETGKAVCDGLPLGLYFVKQTGQVDGFESCTPFMVTVPIETEEGLVYDVDATPKTQVVMLVDITIEKVWNTDEEGLPQSITVQLLNRETVVQTAVLSEENDWSVTYFDMPESDGYTLRENPVPQGYTATYSRRGYQFIVTNTRTLAQTGQLIWPIPVLAMTGLFFLLMGFAILRKSEKKNA